MSKFKRNDAVRVKSLDEIKKSPFYNNFDNNMERYCGTIHFIREIYIHAWYKANINLATDCYKLEDTGFYAWSEDWLEPVFNNWEEL